MTKNRTPTPVYLDPGMHPGLEVKGLSFSCKSQGVVFFLTSSARATYILFVCSEINSLQSHQQKQDIGPAFIKRWAEVSYIETVAIGD